MLWLQYLWRNRLGVVIQITLFSEFEHYTCEVRIQKKTQFTHLFTRLCLHRRESYGVPQDPVLGPRVFATVAPRLWNSLLLSLTSVDSVVFGYQSTKDPGRLLINLKACCLALSTLAAKLKKQFYLLLFLFLISTSLTFYLNEVYANLRSDLVTLQILQLFMMQN